MQSNAQRTEQVKVVECQQWFTVHLPRIFLGLVQWLHALLSSNQEAQRGIYHLPLVDCKTEKSVDFNVLMWTLSGVLPNIFFGRVQQTTPIKVYDYN